MKRTDYIFKQDNKFKHRTKIFANTTVPVQ